MSRGDANASARLLRWLLRGEQAGGWTAEEWRHSLPFLLVATGAIGALEQFPVSVKQAVVDVAARAGVQEGLPAQALLQCMQEFYSRHPPSRAVVASFLQAVSSGGRPALADGFEIAGG